MDRNKTTIPIVFSTSDDYALYCYLAVYSLLKYADRNNYYDIRIFMVSISLDNVKLLEGLTNEYASVTCINVRPYVENVDLRELSFFSVETFYRIFVSQILPEYPRVIYLDADTLILHDIAPLFFVDMAGHPIAAVHDVVSTYLRGHAEEIGLDIRNMFSAGVLVIDTKEYEKKRIRERALEALANDYRNKNRKYIYVDQDVLNVTTYNDVEFLDARWNFQWEFIWRMDSLYGGYREIYEYAFKDPWILHYAGDRKPWSEPLLPYAHYFWEIAGEAGILQKIVEKSIQIERKNEECLKHFKEFRFPYEKVKAGSRVVIYAAGNVGQDFVKQLKNTLFAKVVLWVDKQFSKKPKELGVKSLEEISKYLGKYDYVVIAIDNEKIALEARQYLERSGIPEEKLVWQNYHRCDYE